MIKEMSRIKYCMLDMDRTMYSEVSDWKEKGLPSIKDTIFQKEFFTMVSRIDPLTHVVFEDSRKALEDICSLEQR